ncbi:MAG TPA: ABC transporter ATP-binding protein [Burkholderiales bacterium]|nr:ABC transporter ATP-binding protein [Burkholderiales bacterium]
MTSAATRAHTLAVRRVTHRYGGTIALDDVSVDIPAGELVALLGPSGCGKTTLLRSIAGFVRPDTGEVLLDGESINHLPPGGRGVGIVFQSYALFPHMTVAENVGYGLKAQGASKAAVAERVDEVLELVRLKPLRDRLPRALSGGQQQRVALARVIAVKPRILLLDEPFSALDRNLRLDMQIEIKRLQRELGITAVMVTHDQDEAMSMSDRIAVMNQGRIHQYASPVELYDEPSDLFVSQFIGTTNLLPGTARPGTGAHLSVALDGGTTVALRSAATPAPNALVWLSVRPENLALAKPGAGGVLDAKVVIAMPIGPNLLYEVETARGDRLKVAAARNASQRIAAAGEPVALSIVEPDGVRVFPR